MARNGQGNAAGSGHQPAPGQHLPALRPRSLGPSMASTARTRSRLDRALRRRLRDGLREARPTRGEMLVDLKERLAEFGLALHEDKTRLIEFGRLAGPDATAAWRAASGDLRLPRLHPLLRVDPGRPVHREAQDAEQAPDAQAEGAAPGSVAAHACPAGRAASLVRQRLLRGHYGYYGMPHNWRALNGFLQEVRRIWFNCLRRRSQKIRRMGWDWFEALTARFALAAASDHSSLDSRRGMTRVTSREEPGAGKPPARICEGEAEWPSYSTTTDDVPKRRAVSHFSPSTDVVATVASRPSADRRLCHSAARKLPVSKPPIVSVPAPKDDADRPETARPLSGTAAVGR